jgi:hypothetical protein
MAASVDVGSTARELGLRDDDSLHRARRHRPRLLAVVRAWTSEREPDLAAVRRRLADLDAELVIVCEEGAWSFTRCDRPVFCDRLAGDTATVSAAYGVRGDAVFVIDHRGVVRFAHQPEQPLSATLTDALDAAGEALAWRDSHSQLERVQWSAREWALKCLVVGCTLTFLAGLAPLRSDGTRGAVSLTPRTEVTAPAHARAVVRGPDASRTRVTG